jgi:hypothetical protein
MLVSCLLDLLILFSLPVSSLTTRTGAEEKHLIHKLLKGWLFSAKRGQKVNAQTLHPSAARCFIKSCSLLWNSLAVFACL